MKKNLLLLDSSLKSKYLRTELKDKMYQIKVIDCGDYVQVYEFENYHFSKDKSFLDIKFTDTENLYKKENTNKLKTILLSNALRSNFNIQRLARKNINSWNCFITLTFKENIKDISFANKKFNQFISNVRKLKKDFKYLAVPEFQKRGAVHYHLLSNLDIESGIILPQKNKKGRAKNIDTLYDIKYWNQGFCRVDFIKLNHTKIFSYLTKYMTKDIDNRLFSKKRYFFSQNLDKPTTSFININDINDIVFYKKLISDKSIIYQNEYNDTYTKSNIKFTEFKKTIF